MPAAGTVSPGRYSSFCGAVLGCIVVRFAVPSAKTDYCKGKCERRTERFGSFTTKTRRHEGRIETDLRGYSLPRDDPWVTGLIAPSQTSRQGTGGPPRA